MLEGPVALAIPYLASFAIVFVAKVMPKTCNYELKDRHRVVYRGITNNLVRRLAEHQRDGKQFTHARITSWSFFRWRARWNERRDLAQYRRGHGGHNPRYNRRIDG